MARTPACSSPLDNYARRLMVLHAAVKAVVMKATKQRVAVMGLRIKVWVAVGAMATMCAPLASLAINAVPSDARGAQPDAPTAQPVPAARFSPGVADLLKLVDAKVDVEVIKTYINEEV